MGEFTVSIEHSEANPVGYVDVLDTVRPLHTQYLALAWNGRIVICVCRLPVKSMYQLHTTGFEEHKFGIVLAWCLDLDPFDAALHWVHNGGGHSNSSM